MSCITLGRVYFTMSKRIDSLQSLRALAFIEIFLGHCGISPFMGALGVSIFIILSGFCMAINYIPKSETLPSDVIGCVKFAVSKVKKLYLLHIITAFFAVLLRGAPESITGFIKLAINILLLQSLYPSSGVYFSYNGIAWYLSTYMFICMFAPVILRFIAARNEKKQLIIHTLLIIILMLVCGLATSVIHVPLGDDFAKWFTYICPAYRLLDFALGVILGQAYLMRKNLPELSTAKSVTMLLIAGVLLCLYTSFLRLGLGGIQYNLYFAPVSLLLISLFARSGGTLMKLFKAPMLIKLGNLSSTAFLIHQLTIQGLRQLMIKTGLQSGRLSLALLALVSFAATLVLVKLYNGIRSATPKIGPNENRI